MVQKSNSILFIFVFLGMLTAFGPFVTDMYLPSLPSMTKYFNTSVSMVQMGLTFSMLGLALGQLVFGPLSDAYGRRRILLIAMLLFIVSTLFCIFAPNIEIFVGLRFVQGIAASGGIVIARSVATDKFKRQNLAKALAVVGAINGIAPIAAPVLGGIVLKFVGWQGVFTILLLLGCVLLACCVHFQESLSRQRRSLFNLRALLLSFKTVLLNKCYLYYTLELAFALAILFAYIASSPFVIQQHYHLSALTFSLIFALNAVSLGSGAVLSVRFKSQSAGLKISCIGMLLCSLLLLAVVPNGVSFWIYEALLFMLSFVMGLSFTIATARAMDHAREKAGTASAIMGAMGFLFGSIVSPLAGLGNILLSTGVIMFVCAVAAAWSALKALNSDN